MCGCIMHDSFDGILIVANVGGVTVISLDLVNILIQNVQRKCSALAKVRLLVNLMVGKLNRGRNLVAKIGNSSK